MICLYNNEIKVLEKNLLKKYSNELNYLRQILLNQIKTKLDLEISNANAILSKSDKNKNEKDLSKELKNIKNFNFKCGIIKTNYFCIWKLLISEFKFQKQLTALQVIKYKNILAMAEYIGKFNDDAKSLLNDKALILASYDGRFELVKHLIENGVNVNAKDEEKTTALILASQKGYFEIVKYLVENGADVNGRDFNNKKKSIYISIYGHSEIFRCFDERGIELNPISEWNNTALIFAKFLT